MYVKDAVSVLRRQVQICDDTEFIIFNGRMKTGDENFAQHMFKTYVGELMMRIRNSVRGSSYLDVLWTGEGLDVPSY